MEHEESEIIPSSLPKNPIKKLIRKTLPSEMRVTSNADSLMQGSASEFAYYLIEYAHEIAKQHERLTITTQDILTAMQCYGFDDYAYILSKLQKVDLQYPKTKPKENSNGSENSSLDSSLNSNQSPLKDIQTKRSKRTLPDTTEIDVEKPRPKKNKFSN